MLRLLLFIYTLALGSSALARPGADSNYNLSIGGGASTFLTAPIFLSAGNAAGGAGFFQMSSAGPLSTSAQTTAALADYPISTSGTISNLCITSSFTGTGSNYWTYTITYDDVDQALTVNTLSITAGVPVCDTTAGHNVSYTAGHKVTIHRVATGSPTNDTFQSSFLMTDANGQFGTLFFGPNATPTTVGTQQYMGMGPVYNATENIVSIYFPVSGTIDNLYTNVTAATASQFWTFTVQHDTTVSTPCDTNSATTLSVAYASGAAGISSDTTAGHAFTVAAGDCISIGLLGSTSVMTSTRLYATVRWTPTTNYLYPEFASGTAMPTVTAARFGAPVGTQISTWSATESSAYNLIPTLSTYTMTISNLVAAQSGTIGTTRSWTLRHGTGTQASINPICSETIVLTGCPPGTSTGSSVSGTNFSVNDWIDWQVTDAATATATTWHKESYVANVH